MSSPRFQIPREPGTLKDAEACLVKACGGLEAAAKLTRVSAAQLHRYTAPSEPDTHMPVDVVRALEMHCGIPHVTRFLGFEQRCLLVPLNGTDHAQFSAHLSAIGRDTGKLYAEACSGLKDGNLTPARAAEVEREAYRTIQSLTALIGDVRALRAGTASC